MARNKSMPRLGTLILLAMVVLFYTPECTAREKVRIGVPSSSPPFAFIDNLSGGLRGYCVDLARMLAGLMEANAEFHTRSNSQLLKSLKEGNIDFLCGAMVKPEDHKDVLFVNTGVKIDKKYFVHNACLTVTCHKDLPGHTIALEKDRIPEELLQDAEEVKFLRADSQIEALALVDSGKAEVYISDCSLTSLYLIEKGGFKNIKEVGLPIETVPLSLAVTGDNPELLSALSLAFGKIMENESHKLLQKKWLGEQIGFPAWSRYLRFILIGVGLGGAILSLFVFWNFMLKRRVQKMTTDLQHSEQKYRDLIESSPEMIHLVASDGSIKLTNRIAMIALGYSQPEADALRAYDLVVPEQREEMEAFLKEVFHEGYSSRQFIFLGKEKKTIDVEVVATVVMGMNGEEDLACCFTRDISDRKRLEEDLIQADRLAIMGQMAAGIAHEINNPLGIIMANAQDLLDHSSDEEGRKEGLQSIERNATRAGSIIEQLLSFTTPKEPSMAPVDFRQLIDESLLFLKQKIRQKKITVKKHFPDRRIVLNGDENLLQQLLVNLLLNSIQAIQKDGDGEISIRLNTTGNENRGNMRLEVEDTGMGISEKDLPKIFDPFYTSKREKGFGLGLFISKIIVEKHHGTIEANSRLGHGTVMTVECPLDHDGNME